MLQPAVGEAVHIVTPGNAVQRVGLEHGVVGNPAQFNAVVGQNSAVVLQVLSHLQQRVIFQQRLKQFKHTFAGDLIGRVQIVVGDRHISGHARFNGERKAYHVGGDIIETVGFRIESKQRRFLQLFDPAHQGGFIENGDVVF